MAMNRRIYPRLALALLAVGFVSFMALNNLLNIIRRRDGARSVISIG